jgi:hypothetical protein
MLSKRDANESASAPSMLRPLPPGPRTITRRAYGVCRTVLWFPRRHSSNNLPRQEVTGVGSSPTPALDSLHGCRVND